MVRNGGGHSQTKREYVFSRQSVEADSIVQQVFLWKNQ